MDSAIELLLLVIRGKRLHVRDQHAALPLGDSATRLNSVDHQHKLADGEITLLYRVLHRTALERAHVYVEFPKGVEVGIDAFALGAYAVFGQTLDDLRHGESMIGIRFLLKDLLQIQDLELRFTVVRHASSTLVHSSASLPLESTFYQHKGRHLAMVSHIPAR